MICYILRHGKDDNSVRGGWSDSPLTAEGVRQVEGLSAKILSNGHMNIGLIFSSDLPRAMQTAKILSLALSVKIVEAPAFREVNNGVLAGMTNRLAQEKYPGMYWNTLDWEQPYPNGESPRQFYERIKNAWHCLKKVIQKLEQNVILVTHGGFMNVIQCIEYGVQYSNKFNLFPVDNAEFIEIEI